MNSFVSAIRSVHAVGHSYSAPANLLDGDLNTTADIYLTGAGQADWFILDLGAEILVGSVTLANVTSSGNPIGVWVSESAGDPNQGDPGQLTAPTPAPSAAGVTWTFTAPDGGKTGRYVLIRQFEIGSQTGFVVIGDVTFAPSTPTDLPAVPTLTATPTLVDGVPTIVLAAH